MHRGSQTKEGAAFVQSLWPCGNPWIRVMSWVNVQLTVWLKFLALRNSVKE